MPHLSQLQRDNQAKGLTVIGVTSVDRGNTLDAVKAMVEDKGDVMGYTVAVDVERTTNEAWMKASGQRGIPTSFLVDKAGKVAWIGHPMNADLPLAMILDGSWGYESGPALIAKIDVERSAIYKAAQASPEKALELLDAFEKDYPLLAGSMDNMRFSMMLTLPEMSDKCAALGEKLVKKAITAGDPSALNQMAWTLVDPESDLEERHLDLALRAAEAASRLTEDKDPAILDTLARAQFWKGDLDKAVVTQMKAIANAEGPMKESLEEVLAEYQKAIDKTKVGAGK